jgi:hypothetical protein
MKHNADGDVVVVASRQWADDLVLRGVPSNPIIRLAYGVDREAFSLLTEIARRHISEKVFSACVAPQGRRVGQQFVPPQVFIREDLAAGVGDPLYWRGARIGHADHAAIPDSANRFYLGGLSRLLAQPSVFIPRLMR